MRDTLLAKPGSAELDGLALDVGIASPTTATAIRLQHADTTHLVAAKALEAAKRAKYDGIEPGARFLPVVFENTGAPGDHARSVLKTIAMEVQRHATETVLWRAAQLVQQRVAIALHHGNWLMIRGVVSRSRAATTDPVVRGNRID